MGFILLIVFETKLLRRSLARMITRYATLRRAILAAFPAEKKDRTPKQLGGQTAIALRHKGAAIINAHAARCETSVSDLAGLSPLPPASPALYRAA